MDLDIQGGPRADPQTDTRRLHHIDTIAKSKLKKLTATDKICWM